jgi:hypothetical protein
LATNQGVVGSIPASRTKIEQGFTSSDVDPFSLVT